MSKNLRPYQAEAVRLVTGHLLTHDRAQVKMACGSGKTIVAQEIVQSVVDGVENPVVLALFPNLHLVSQTMESWRTNTSSPFKAFALSSALKSVGEDETEDLEVSNLAIDNSTNAHDIANWLEANPSGLRVVFGTYQSSHQLAKTPGLLPEWDLIVFDEAHRAAGSPTSRFATAVNNDLIPAKKRFFATATPLIAGNSKVDSSDMDDESRFGRRVFSYTHKQAVNEKFINDFKVLFVAVTDEEVMTHMNAEKKIVLPNGATLEPQEAAAAIAVSKAGKTLGLKASLTYHNSRERSRNFSTALALLDDEVTYPDGATPRALTPFHVDGSDKATSADVLDKVRRVTKEDRYVVSNVKLLNEGVDVQGLDSLCFVDPRKSIVDTVQAVGRVIRLDHTEDSQTDSVVILPVLVDHLDPTEDHIADTVHSTKFAHIYDTLNALHAHDSELDDELLIQGHRAKKRQDEYDQLVAEGDLEAAAALEAQMLDDLNAEHGEADSFAGTEGIHRISEHISALGVQWSDMKKLTNLHLVVAGRKRTSHEFHRGEVLIALLDRGQPYAEAQRLANALYNTKFAA